MMRLEKYAGLPIELREDLFLDFAGSVAPVAPAIRDFSSMRSYLKDASSPYWRRDVYHMYRGVAREEHEQAIREANLEYDLTVIPPGKIGNEYVKTIGHYHAYKPGAPVRYPEVYEVVYGKVFWILQSASDDLERLEKVYAISAERGEKIIVPPGYGHVSVNPTDDVLILSNWQSLGNKGIYEPYEKHNGAAYYVTEAHRLGTNGKTTQDFEFAPNLTYNHVPKLIHAKPRELPQYDLRSALPVYFTGTKNLKSLDFLNNPENYLDELIPEKLFK
ncbi:hypothetical protein D4R52_00935 [bacterium]|nr:MAG: hypothetical protein D4R52_00935 [bacterium]